jgi:hypothetical protein
MLAAVEGGGPHKTKAKGLLDGSWTGRDIINTSEKGR